MLVFVGLGLCGNETISLQGLKVARGSDWVYAEFYTSPLPELDLDGLKTAIGKPIKTIDRKTMEEDPTEILEKAKSGRVTILVPGDPMVATTHVDLRLRAARMGIPTSIVHSSSIISAVPGLTGLQSYKFGRSATIPFPDNPSKVPYEALVENSERGLHTLLLLDLRREEGKHMLAREGIEIMFSLESELGKGAFKEERLTVAIARAGCLNPVVRAGRAGDLVDVDLGPPPHVLVVPGKLHFLEEEALRVFAGAPLTNACRGKGSESQSDVYFGRVKEDPD